MSIAPGRRDEAARDERRAATTEREAPPAAARAAVAGVSPVIRAWLDPRLPWRCDRCGVVLGLAGSGLCGRCRS